ncbi:uncharacterized protein CTRU02_205288 [Colletotrichum truncatum]|uniref:Uncharacterized protein n=1 Tax=Colletotrichum truncatum TaxID=5467 RepID=A0ACC3Z3J7_COLTU|nr:uncharacterized protein CTRU02_04344 [Colletotrichum truncatum]KAF6795534.1 hypothetical protein CTRU02_04344 [Colletotrichum truncatum]
MQLTKTLVTLLMGMTVASALALPPQAQADGLAPRAEAATAADKNKKNGNKNTNANKGKTTAKAAGGDKCANAKKLAAGIDKNIQIQKKEQSNVAAVKKIVNSNNINQGQFDQAKKTLLATVNDGIKVREANQKLAQGNGASSGLNTVAKAQSTELKQAQSLKGTKADLQVIAQLEKEFAGGIEQNTKNKAAALKGC